MVFMCDSDYYKASRQLRQIYRMGQRQDHIYKFITHVYDEVGRHSIYQNVHFLSGIRLIF